MKSVLSKLSGLFKTSTKVVLPELPKWARGLANLQKKITYDFHDLTLLEAALTHKSYLHKQPGEHKGPSPFERMEFLGDSILGFVVSKELFQKYLDEPEGNLSKLKSKIVSETYLTIKADSMDLGKYILLSPEETQSGGQGKPSILSDTMEALIGAIYLDGGISASSQFIKHHILTDYENLVNRIELVNYKSILQEYLQARSMPPPTYITVGEEGPQHNKLFVIDVTVDGKVMGRGKGSTKKAAHQEAARKACQKLGI